MNNSLRLRRRLGSKSAVALAVSLLAVGPVAVIAPAVAQGLPAHAPTASPPSPLAAGGSRDDGQNAVPTLDGAEGAVEKLMSEADGRLSKLSGGALPNADVSSHQSDLDAMAAIQRDIQILQLKNQKAELATTLWKTLNDLENPEEKERASGATTSTGPDVVSVPPPPAAAAPAVTAAPKVDEPPALPVIVSLSGVGNALRANLLVPYKGEITVRSGDVLPNGMRVVTVTSTGVVVRDGKKTWSLGFGSEVPSAPPPPPSAFPVGFNGAVPGMVTPGMAIPPLGTVMPGVVPVAQSSP